MKKKVREEFRLKDSTELKRLLKESEDLLLKLKLDKVQNKLKNQKQIFWERKKIAFFLTLVNEKERLGALAKAKNVKEKDEKRSKA